MPAIFSLMAAFVNSLKQRIYQTKKGLISLFANWSCLFRLTFHYSDSTPFPFRNILPHLNYRLFGWKFHTNVSVNRHRWWFHFESWRVLWWRVCCDGEVTVNPRIICLTVHEITWDCKWFQMNPRIFCLTVREITWDSKWFTNSPFPCTISVSMRTMKGKIFVCLSLKNSFDRAIKSKFGSWPLEDN